MAGHTGKRWYGEFAQNNGLAHAGNIGRHQAHVGPHAAFAQGLVVTTLPRGGLQVAQPLNVSDSPS